MSIPRPLEQVRCDTCKKLMYLRPLRGARRQASQGKPYQVHSVGEYNADGGMRVINITNAELTPIRCAKCEAKAEQPALHFRI